MNHYEVMVQREDSRVKFSVYIIAQDLNHAEGQVDHMNNTIGNFNYSTQELHRSSVKFTLTGDILEGFTGLVEIPSIH
jgi:hypothetical protein